MAIDRIAEANRININQHKFKAMVGSGIIGGSKVLLVKPLTYMNLSGESIRPIMDFYKLDLSDILVIYDDISLEPGMLRLRTKGSAGGHNGMKSIIKHLGGDTFPRIRVGIGGECILINSDVIHSTKCTAPNKAILFQIPLTFLSIYIPDADQLVFNLDNPNNSDIRRTKLDIFKDTLSKMQIINDIDTDEAKSGEVYGEMLGLLAEILSNNRGKEVITAEYLEQEEYDIEEIIAYINDYADFVNSIKNNPN